MLLTFTGEAMSTAERYDDYRQNRWGGPSVRMHPAWIVLLILGFIVWWPVGLAILAFAGGALTLALVSLSIAHTISGRPPRWL